MTVVEENLVMAGGVGKAPMSLEELQEVLQLYNDVTVRLQGSHERLQAEVARLTEQLEQKNKELELKKRLAALGEMAAGMAHEIRNPLGGIQLYASSLMNDVADRPGAAELVRKISNGVRHLNGLVNDILAFTQHVKCEKQEVEIAEVVANVVELARPAGVPVRTEVRGLRTEALVAVVDGRLLGRALLNLVLNAADAVKGREGGNIWVIAKNAECGMRNAELRRSVEIIVEDNGPGIPAGVLDQIFNPFYTTKDTGTGLGLAIVHRIVEAHGGVITAENRQEGGARFRIVI